MDTKSVENPVIKNLRDGEYGRISLSHGTVPPSRGLKGLKTDEVKYELQILENTQDCPVPSHTYSWFQHLPSMHPYWHLPVFCQHLPRAVCTFWSLQAPQRAEIVSPLSNFLCQWYSAPTQKTTNAKIVLDRFIISRAFFNFKFWKGLKYFGNVLFSFLKLIIQRVKIKPCPSSPPVHLTGKNTIPRAKIWKVYY